MFTQKHPKPDRPVRIACRPGLVARAMAVLAASLLAGGAPAGGAPGQDQWVPPPGVPIPPKDFKIARQTDRSVTLTWRDISDNETRFVIHRSGGPGNVYRKYTVISRDPEGKGGVQSFSQTGLADGQYWYSITARNAKGDSFRAGHTMVVVRAQPDCSGATSASCEGFAEGYLERAYPCAGNGVPLLRSFYFGYGVRSTPVDHHFAAISVMPAGTAEELIPSGSTPPHVVQSGKIGLMFADKNKDDEYFYKVSHYTGPLSRGIRRYRMCEVGCVGRNVRTIPRLPSRAGLKGTFVLVGFYVYFPTGRDRHVREIAVFENNGKLHVTLQDKEDTISDHFVYIVDFAWVSPLRIRRRGESGGSARGGARVSVPRGTKVIRGFRFDFGKDKDRHLREVGVLPMNDKLEVYFADKNGDDRFDWRVQWAVLGDRPAKR